MDNQNKEALSNQNVQTENTKESSYQLFKDLFELKSQVEQLKAEREKEPLVQSISVNNVETSFERASAVGSIVDTSPERLQKEIEQASKEFKREVYKNEKEDRFEKIDVLMDLGTENEINSFLTNNVADAEEGLHLQLYNRYKNYGDGYLADALSRGVECIKSGNTESFVKGIIDKQNDHKRFVKRVRSKETPDELRSPRKNIVFKLKNDYIALRNIR